MSNKNGGNTAPTIWNWFSTPQPQYIPMSDVVFSGGGPVMPHMLPPNAMTFPNAQFNKMLNIPSAEAIYDKGRTGRIF